MFCSGHTNAAFSSLSVLFSHMESPISDIVVSSVVKDKWLPGSEVLITSHTLSSDDQHIRTLVAVQDRGNGLVKLTLDTPIPRPMLTGDEEVALLSRNIVFESAADDRTVGHLTVYRTPSRTQKIAGVEFKNFGQNGTFNQPVRAS